MQEVEDVIINLVIDHGKWMSGQSFDTTATYWISKPKESSSSVQWLRVLTGKILSYLSKRLHSNHYPMITIAMVEEFHQTCSNTLHHATNTKWAILYSWQLLCGSLIRHAKACVNQLTASKEREICEWY